jgi:hypothetical protein
VSGYMWAIGECVNCRRRFSFNPDRVPAIRMRNGRPDAAGVRAPVCSTCYATWNARRIAAGLPAIPALPGAYDLVDEGGGDT